MKATLSDYHQSPRKVRLVANLVRGKNIESARRILMFADQKSSPILKKLLESAIANAKNAGIDTKDLVVKDLQIGKGLVMKRFMARSRGRGAPIKRRTSHIFLTLGDATVKGKKGRPDGHTITKRTPKTTTA
jgi:large subunit ribosomal protein L22